VLLWCEELHTCLHVLPQAHGRQSTETAAAVAAHNCNMVLFARALLLLLLQQ
jgi:hypothetical protein